MTQDSFAILIDNIEEGKNILIALKTKKFKNFIKNSCSWSNFRIDYRLFIDFNKDWWKEFINEEISSLMNEPINEPINKSIIETKTKTGNELLKKIEVKNVKELKQYCRDNKIKGFSNKKKQQLKEMIYDFHKK